MHHRESSSLIRLVGRGLRGDRRRGEESTDVLLEIYRVLESKRRKLLKDGYKAIVIIRLGLRGRIGTHTFSAVESSRRLKKHEAAMIEALSRDIVYTNGRA
jgi:hypothetical protein